MNDNHYILRNSYVPLHSVPLQATILYPKNVIEGSFPSNSITKELRDVEEVLEYLLMENIHGQNTVPDQTVTGVDRGHRCNGCQEKIRIAVALVLHRSADWKG